MTRDLTSSEEAWHLYIIECRTGELYVGICKDVQKRLKLHNAGRATRYTKYRIPAKLIYSEFCGDYANARKRERIVKKFSREKKIALAEKIKTSHPQNGFEVREIFCENFSERCQSG